MDAKLIEKEALALPDPLRADLAWRLLQTLPASDMDVTDEDVARRSQELESGAVEGLSHDEFVRRVDKLRGQ